MSAWDSTEGKKKLVLMNVLEICSIKLLNVLICVRDCTDGFMNLRFDYPFCLK